MNPIAIAHLFASVIVIALAVPLIRKRVKMNSWHGVRIPAAFASEEAWFDINQYGGRLLLIWGIAIAATAMTGLFIKKNNWIAYDWTALVIIQSGLFFVVARIYCYARKKQAITLI